MPASFLWYDLETFGTDPAADRVAQFAAVRTDGDFREKGERILLYCKPGFDSLPDPRACLVHGITPAHADEAGLSEYEFAKALRAEMMVSGTTTGGYNTLAFDDEFVRHLFWRTLFDPYEREWANGNSRWDLIDLARAARDLRPEGLVWPNRDDGKPSFRLEVLAKANGIAHDNAHDALSDVLATIGLARLLRDKQPKLFRWYWTHRSRDSLTRLVDLVERTPLVHAAAGFTTGRGCTTLVAPLAIDPENRNNLFAVDLRFDPEAILDLGPDEIRERVFAKTEELEGERIPLVKIRLNRCPFLAPASVMTRDAAERLGVDTAAAERRRALLARHPELIQKMVAAFELPGPREESADPDFRLYSGSFVGDDDKARLSKVHAALDELGPAAAKREAYALKFRDERLAQLVRRFWARNFPGTLSPAEAGRWRDFCAARLQLPPGADRVDLAEYERFVMARLDDPATPARDRAVLHALLDWKRRMETEVLSWRGEAHEPVAGGLPPGLKAGSSGPEAGGTPEDAG
ncbi:MAG: exodeoxyribonuclease I [Spirochaetales bacterium]|nr:exodeoxyribonuclease I [Spirochaetales bacterium]